MVYPNLDIPKFLFEFADLARDSGFRIYLVGGGVRDLLLGQTLLDYDLVVESNNLSTESSNSLELVHILSNKGLAEIQSLHPDFGTAKLIFKNSSIDLATTRKEEYPFPGALPIVKYPTSIQEDLCRRDFTINSIACRLDENFQFQIVDPFKGLEDLKNKIIRVLHSKSYLEDPTRIIRAVRFATKFNFKLAPEDIQQIELALLDPQLQQIIKRIRGLRFGIELKRLLELNNWLDGATLLSELAGWVMLGENLVVNLQKPEREILDWETRLLWILWNNYDSLPEIINLLGFSAKKQKDYKKTKDLFEKLSSVSPFLSLKQFYEFDSLENDFKALVFSLNNKLEKTYQIMINALPKESPEELIAQGFKGKQISDELERIFRENR